MPGDVTLASPPEAMQFAEDCFHLSPEGYLELAQNLWDQYYAARFGNSVFIDGFESGDLSAWL